MEAYALSSGSSGNCFLVSNGKNSILIDAGISCKQIEGRMSSIRKKVENVKGIFVTHEHSDHIRGIEVFTKKHPIPIFATKKLIENKSICNNESLLNSIKKEDSLSIGGMEITSFPKIHKAIEPIGFTIMDKKSGKRISIITDAGNACKNIMDQVSQADALFFESNHDLEMLERGPYPYFLKKWIKGDDGHLSNIQSSSCILENAKSRLKYLILCHLSEHNNTPELAFNIHKKMLKQRNNFKPKIFVSTKDPVSKMIKLS